MKSFEEQKDILNYLFQGGQLLESILQTYRTIYLTLQSIFLAIGIGLFVALISLENKFYFFIPFLAMSIFGLFTSIKMQKLIKSRGDYSSFWYYNLIKKENEIVEEELRYFTRYFLYIWEKDIDNFNNFNEKPNKILEDEEIENEMGKDEGGPARKFFNTWFFRGVYLIWTVLILLSIIYVIRIILSTNITQSTTFLEVMKDFL